MIPQKPPSIEDHQTLIEFLHAYFQYKKSLRPGWSYEVWARSIGLASGSLLSKVMRGERELSEELFLRLVKFFRPSEAALERWLALHAADRIGRLREESKRALTSDR